jgi:hypothetical protein
MAECPADTKLVSRIKTLRSSQAGTLTKQCNKAIKAFLDERSKATLRDIADNIISACGILLATNDLYLSLLSSQYVSEARQWMLSRQETAQSVILEIGKKLDDSDLKSETSHSIVLSAIDILQQMEIMRESMRIDQSILRKNLEQWENKSLQQPLEPDIVRVKQERVHVVEKTPSQKLLDDWEQEKFQHPKPEHLELEGVHATGKTQSLKLIDDS